MSEITEGRSVKSLKAGTGGAPGMVAGGGCAEGEAILCAQVHQGQGSGLCSEAHRLTSEKAVSR